MVNSNEQHAPALLVHPGRQESAANRSARRKLLTAKSACVVRVTAVVNVREYNAMSRWWTSTQEHARYFVNVMKLGLPPEAQRQMDRELEAFLSLPAPQNAAQEIKLQSEYLSLTARISEIYRVRWIVIPDSPSPPAP